MNEFENLEKKGIIKDIRVLVKENASIKIQHYLSYLFAGILIIVPGLPDEVGVTMLAGLTTIKTKTFAWIAFVLHSLAIFLILSIGLTI